MDVWPAASEAAPLISVFTPGAIRHERDFRPAFDSVPHGEPERGGFPLDWAFRAQGSHAGGRAARQFGPLRPYHARGSAHHRAAPVVRLELERAFLELRTRL